MKVVHLLSTYNEKENLKILLPKILAVFKKNQLDGEIIVVDGRSDDGSFEYLNEQTKLIISVVNIILIAVLVYKRKYNWAWALSLLEVLLVLIR